MMVERRGVKGLKKHHLDRRLLVIFQEYLVSMPTFGDDFISLVQGPGWIGQSNKGFFRQTELAVPSLPAVGGGHGCDGPG